MKFLNSHAYCKNITILNFAVALWNKNRVCGVFGSYRKSLIYNIKAKAIGHGDFSEH